MNNRDRIRLAEAMGHGAFEKVFHADFDPFTDANDDYAVLEWGVDILGRPFIDAVNELIIHEPAQYERGDYARAAIKVLNDE